MKPFIFFYKLILIFENVKILISYCSRDTPFLKNGICFTNCSKDEIDSNICILDNEIIKTQNLTNIIQVGAPNYHYINLITTENGDLIYSASSYPNNTYRVFFGLTKEGKGYFYKDNKRTEFSTITLNDRNNLGRFEFEIFPVKLFDSSTDNNEYIMTVSKSNQYLELYDLKQTKGYSIELMETFGLYNIFQEVGTIFKLKNKSNNVYIIGFLGSEYFCLINNCQWDCSFQLINFNIEYFYLIQIQFSYLNINKTPPITSKIKVGEPNNIYTPTTLKCCTHSCPTQQYSSIDVSSSKIISCYETTTNYILCFHQKKTNYYTITVYSENLKYLTELDLHLGDSENYNFFKCIHFFNKTGIFTYFSNSTNADIIFQFKDYDSNSNKITDHYEKTKYLNFGNNLFERNIKFNDIIKINDQKFFYVTVSVNKAQLYIVSINNYYEEQFMIRIYKINILDLYNYAFGRSLRTTNYNNFLSMASSYNTKGVTCSSLIIFSYPNSTDINMDVLDTLLSNNDIKINNITLNLNCKLENNIFGYINIGIQIIHNCTKENIYLSSISNTTIESNYFLNGSDFYQLNLIISKSNIYYRFKCEITYYCIATEPDFEIYNNYSFKMIDNGEEGNKEDKYFNNQKTNYTGRYSDFNISLINDLTEENCKKNCELCVLSQIDQCITCKYDYNISDNYKLCFDKIIEEEKEEEREEEREEEKEEKEEGKKEEKEEEGEEEKEKGKKEEKNEEEEKEEEKEEEGEEEREEEKEEEKKEEKKEGKEEEGEEEKEKGKKEEKSEEEEKEEEKEEEREEEKEKEKKKEKNEEEEKEKEKKEEKEEEQEEKKEEKDNEEEKNEKEDEDKDKEEEKENKEEKKEEREEEKEEEKEKNEKEEEKEEKINEKLEEKSEEEEGGEKKEKEKEEEKKEEKEEENDEELKEEEREGEKEKKIDKEEEEKEKEKEIEKQKEEEKQEEEIEEKEIKEKQKKRIEEEKENILEENNEEENEEGKINEKNLEKEILDENIEEEYFSEKSKKEIIYEEEDDKSNKISDTLEEENRKEEKDIEEEKNNEEKKIDDIIELIENKEKLNEKEETFGEYEDEEIGGNYKEDKTYNNTHEEEFDECSLEGIKLNLCKKRISEEKIKSVYQYFEEELINDNYKAENILIRTLNAKFQLSLLGIQLSSDNYLVSNLDLGECENEIKRKNNISSSKQLIIFKLDLVTDDNTKTFVYYEIYNPDNFKRINIQEDCKDILIDIYTPVILDDETLFLYSNLSLYGYNLFDENGPFYNNICTIYTTQKGSDILLIDRKKDIFNTNGNIALCQQNCELVLYNEMSRKAKCNCDVQKNEVNINLIKNINNIKFDKKEIKESFFEALSYSNFRVMKCYKIAFDFKHFFKNIGRAIMTLILLLLIILIILYYLNGRRIIKRYFTFILKNKYEIKHRLNGKTKKNKHKHSSKHKHRNKNKNKSKHHHRHHHHKREKSKEKKESNEHSKEKHRNKNLNEQKLTGLENSNNKLDFPNPPKNQSLVNSQDMILNKDTSNIVSPKNAENKDKILELKTSFVYLNEKFRYTLLKNRTIILNDEELNNLEYKKAIYLDKRNYCQYYWSLLKTKQLILFTFIKSDDYNLKIIKMCLLLLSFSLYFTINGFFFIDDTMHKIYINNGIYKILFQIPIMIYSTLVSAVINFLLKKLSLTGEQILELKQEKDFLKAKKKSKELIKCIYIKLSIFFSMSFIFMLFFWYFISCFCGVYINTQSILITDTLISFGLSMIYPFALSLFPGFFRVPALRAEKKDKEIIYKIGCIIAYI